MTTPHYQVLGADACHTARAPAGLLNFRFGGRCRRQAYRRAALNELHTMRSKLCACRAPEALAVRDASDSPVGVHTSNCTVSAPRQGTGTMLFVSLGRLHVRL